jgi:hypothetical protein
MGLAVKAEEEDPMAQDPFAPLHAFVQFVLGEDAARATMDILTLAPDLQTGIAASTGICGPCLSWP